MTGRYLYDADGTEYIDCFAGISVTNAGHHNQQILDAAIAQANKLVHACSYVYHVESVGALAEKLAEVTPGDLQKTLLRQRRRRGHRGRLPPRQALLAARTSSSPSSRASTAAPTRPSR